MSNKKDTFIGTMGVVLAVCLVCSIVVASAAIGLRPLQIANKEKDVQQNILAVAGLETDKSLSEIFKDNIEAKLVDLATGEFVTDVEASSYDQRSAAKDPAQSIKLTADQNIAGIGRRANIATVYLVSNDNGKLERIILPVHGAGLWAPMYAFIAIQADGNTVDALTFYEHGETPGLGGEITNPRWRSIWVGKTLFDEQGNPAIDVIKGQSPKGDAHKIDGLSGATLTGNGVEHIFTFWLGNDGFGPFLKKVQAGGLNNG